MVCPIGYGVERKLRRNFSNPSGRTLAPNFALEFSHLACDLIRLLESENSLVLVLGMLVIAVESQKSSGEEAKRPQT